MQNPGAFVMLFWDPLLGSLRGSPSPRDDISLYRSTEVDSYIEEIQRDRDEWKRIAAARKVVIGEMGQEIERLNLAFRTISEHSDHNLRLAKIAEAEAAEWHGLFDRLLEHMKMAVKATP